MEQMNKSWSYTELKGKHETHHTISIRGNQFTHEAEIKEAGRESKERLDFNLSNVNSVRTYYGCTKNIALGVLLVVLAAFSFILSIVQFAGDSAVMGIVFLLLAGVLGVVAYFVFKAIKPSFALEIQTVVPQGTIVSHGLSYGNAVIYGTKKGFLATLFGRGNSSKYKFEMSPEVGFDIVETIGEYCIH